MHITEKENKTKIHKNLKYQTSIDFSVIIILKIYKSERILFNWYIYNKV